MRQAIASWWRYALHPACKVRDPRVLDRRLRCPEVVIALCDLIEQHEPQDRLVILSGKFGEMMSVELGKRGYTTTVLPGGLKDTPAVLPEGEYGEVIFADDTCFTGQTTRNVEHAVREKGGRVVATYYGFSENEGRSLCNYKDLAEGGYL